MNPAIMRIVSCVIALSATALIFPGSCNFWGLLWGTVMLTILYILLRPLIQLVCFPFNAVLLGLVTPFVDALLVRWTVAWVGGLQLTYWQCLVTALLIGVAYYPYSAWKQRRVQLDVQ